MMKFIEEIIKWGKLTPIYDLLGKRSYAQSGEDVVVDAILNRQKRGFYVDVGAYHPKVFSNTYLFYKRGWKGVCVEPNPGAKILFEIVRLRDRFVGCGVGEKTQKLKNSKTQNNVMEYYVFGEGATNTFSKKQRNENIRSSRRLLEVKKIPVKTLKEILDENVPKGQKIDLMSVDVEGMDLEVLKSNDWKKYRPKVVIAEDMTGVIAKREMLWRSRKGMDCHGSSTKLAMTNDSVVGYLVGKGYRLVGMTGYSMIFRIG